MNIQELKRLVLSNEPEDKATVLGFSGDMLFLFTLVSGWFFEVFDNGSVSNVVGYYSMMILSFMLNLTAVLLRAMVRIEKRKTN